MLKLFVFLAAMLTPATQAYATKCGIPHMGAKRAFDDDLLNAIRKQYHINLLDHINELVDALPHDYWSRDHMACRIAITMIRAETDSKEDQGRGIAFKASLASSRPYATTLPLLAMYRWTQEVSNMLCGGHEIQDNLEDPCANDTIHEEQIAPWSTSAMRTIRCPEDICHPENSYCDQFSNEPRASWPHPFPPDQLAKHWQSVDALQRARQKYFHALDTALTGLAHAAGADPNDQLYASYNHFKGEILAGFGYPSMVSEWARVCRGRTGYDQMIAGLSDIRREWAWELTVSYDYHYRRPIPEWSTPESTRGMNASCDFQPGDDLPRK